jgi:transposase
VAAYDGQEGTRQEVAKRFKVSEGMVKKLLAQRNRTGDLRPRYRFCGRKPGLEPKHAQSIRQLVAKEPDVTLEEIKQQLGLDYTIGAIHWVLTRLGLTYKKRLSMRPSKTGPMSPRPARTGNAARLRSTQPGSSSSTSRRPRQT